MTQVDRPDPRPPRAAPDRASPRSVLVRALVGVVWSGIVAGTALALANRSADVAIGAIASIFLTLLIVPGVVFGTVEIRTPAILGVTAALSCTFAALGAWAVLRDSSTVAIGVFTVPLTATSVVFVGWLCDRRWRAMKARRIRTAPHSSPDASG